MRLSTTALPVLALAASSLSLGAVACDKPTSTTETTSATQAPTTGIPTSTVPASEKPPVTKTEPDPMTTLDSDMKTVIDKLASLGGKPIETLTPADARKQPTPADAVMGVLKDKGKPTTPEEVGKVENKTITTAGGPLPIRVYTPKTGKAPYPVVVYFHGGGWVIATNDTYDSSERGLANGAGAIVISPEYRKGPEVKFPGAHDDALATYEWTLKNAASVGGNPKLVALAGESAGGNMAVATSIAARDKGEQMPVFELVVYPLASPNAGTPSDLEDTNAKPLSAPMVGWFATQYTRTPADLKDPRIDLVDAKLTGLEPTLIVNAQVDPLRSDGEQLAKNMKAAGVTVDQKTYSGVTHEFFGMGIVVSKAKDAMDLGSSKLKSAFNGAKSDAGAQSH